MKPEEIRQLLGGYASGTLSAAEKTLLFEAALEDQVLFDAMADEQALKDLLDDPESRGYLQAVLDEPVRQGVAGPAVYRGRTVSAPQAPPAPAPAQAQMPTETRRRRPPQMWWGLLAAAGLAVVSVVGILRLNERGKATEMAKNDQPVPQGTVAGKAAPVAPANPIPHPEPKPAISKPVVAPATKSADKAAAGPGTAALDTKQVNEVSKAAAPAEPPAVKPVGGLPDQTARKEAEARAPAPAPPPPPAQSQQPVTTQSNRVQTAQAPTLATPSQMPGARQMYFSGESQAREQTVLKDQSARDQLAREQAKTQSSKDEAAAVGGRTETKRKAGPAAGGALGGAVPSRAAVPAPAVAKSAATTIVPRAPFAMRYRILRRGTGTDFVPVAPGTRFRTGEEIVVQIDKNSGGTAEIARAGVGSVPMSIQTTTMARSAPLTVTGAMELTITLTRTGAGSSGPLQGTLAQPAASQQSEVADGMVYVAEPAATSGQPLVVRIAIPVAQ